MVSEMNTDVEADIVLLSGGQGQRLWPASKFFVPIAGDKYI